MNEMVARIYFNLLQKYAQCTKLEMQSTKLEIELVLDGTYGV